VGLPTVAARAEPHKAKPVLAVLAMLVARRPLARPPHDCAWLRAAAGGALLPGGG